MARDDDDDLYDEEFDFVDDDDEEFDEESDAEGEPVAKERAADDGGRDDRDERDGRSEGDERDGDVDQAADEEPEDEYGRTAPKADYVVHIYEHEKFKRTIDRPFTPEDAEAFATEYNRSAKSYGRVAVTGKNDGKPKKTLD